MVDRWSMGPYTTRSIDALGVIPLLARRPTGIPSATERAVVDRPVRGSARRGRTRAPPPPLPAGLFVRTGDG